MKITVQLGDGFTLLKTQTVVKPDGSYCVLSRFEEDNGSQKDYGQTLEEFIAWVRAVTSKGNPSDPPVSQP